MKKLRTLLILLILLLFGACTSLNQNTNGDRGKDAWNLWGGDTHATTTTNRSSNPDDPSSENGGNSSSKDPSGALVTDGGEIESIMDEAIDFCTVAQDYWQKGELENAIEALDQAYTVILNIDTRDQPKLIQQKEDLRFMISKRILEIYASRHTVVNGAHKAIPMSMNKHVQAEINRFKGPERQFFIDSYRRSGRYRPYILKALKAAGLPEELSWLPLIESGFKVNALSRARALGLWQFIPSTGYKFGLQRDKYIDERLDPVKATSAAIDYLKELHQIFGDWTTVLAAYNCGEGRVLRVIRSQKINYLDNFWDLYERLPRETARYVPRFLATLHVIKNADEFGLGQVSTDVPLDFETVMVNKQIHLKNIAPTLQTSEKVMHELNPELRYKILPSNSYSLRVPPGKGDILVANLDKIPVSHPPRRAYVYHRIRNGETLSTIARRYRTSVNKIMRANRLRRSNYIVAGRVLKIPQRGYVSTPTKKPRNKAVQQRASRHVVRRGDSLWNIARRYGTTTQKIQSANRLKNNTLKIGQVLAIPGTAPKKVDTSKLNTYKVKSGDSPYLIAVNHSMSLNRFLSINNLTPRSRIYPGQKVYVE